MKFVEIDIELLLDTRLSATARLAGIIIKGLVEIRERVTTKEVAEMIGCSVSHFEGAIRELEKNGYLIGNYQNGKIINWKYIVNEE